MSLGRNVIHINYAVVDAIDLYSASALDRATLFCFFELQEMQLLPR